MEILTKILANIPLLKVIKIPAEYSLVTLTKIFAKCP